MRDSNKTKVNIEGLMNLKTVIFWKKLEICEMKNAKPNKDNIRLINIAGETCIIFDCLCKI
jgi:hypothetical protein